MDTTQLKMIVEAFGSLGVSAQTALYFWTIANNLGSVLIAVVLAGAALLIVRTIVDAVRGSNDDSRLIAILREHFKFSSYEEAKMIAYLVDNAKPRDR